MSFITTVAELEALPALTFVRVLPLLLYNVLPKMATVILSTSMNSKQLIMLNRNPKAEKNQVNPQINLSVVYFIEIL